MPKIILSIPIDDIGPITVGVQRYKLQSKYSPWIDGTYEGKLFWEGYDAAKNEDPIFIKDGWNEEIEIFDGHKLINKKIKK